jgi:hypothetical protein
MTLLLSLVVTQACQQHGFLLSFHDDCDVMQRRQLTMIGDDAKRLLELPSVDCMLRVLRLEQALLPVAGKGS